MEKLAQVNIGNEYGSPFSGQGGSTIGELVSNIMQGAIGVAGLILFFMMLASGIAIIASSGSGNSDGAEKAKKTATSALIGFLLVAFTYIIIELIQTVLGGEFLSLTN